MVLALGMAVAPTARAEWSSTLATGSTVSATEPEPTLKLSGNRTTTLRYQHYEGLAPAASGFYQSGFTRHETTKLKVSGQALETIKVEGELYQNDVDLDNRYHLKLSTEDSELELGEFSAGFEGSEFTLFSRQLQGAKLTSEVLKEGDRPVVEITAVGSSPRGEPQHERFFGTDTQGPYQLGRTPIVLGSEEIRVDKVKQVRNTDYEVNNLTGQVTFKKRIIERRSLIEASYEARQTLYSRALYGGQIRYHPTESDTIGLIGLDERDRKDAGTYAASGTPATAHSVGGLTLKHDGEFLRTGGEAALSLYDPDRFLRGREHGGAYKGELELERWGGLIGGDAKRIEPRYRTLGNTALGQDLASWSSHGSFALGRVLMAGGEHQQQRTRLGGVADRQRNTEAKATLAPKGWPMAGYRFAQNEEMFLPNFDRLDRRHSADLTQVFTHVSLGTGYEHQVLINRDGLQPNQTWDAGKANLGLTGYSWLSAALNGELREGRQSSSPAVSAGGRSATLLTGSSWFRTALGTANVGWTPHTRYFLGANNSWQKTTGQQARTTLRTEAKAQPVDQVSTQASFSQETLQQPYVGVVHDARTDTYAGTAEVTPVKSVSLQYQPSLRQTVFTGLRPAVNLTGKDTYTARWAAGSMVSTEGGFTSERYRLRDANDPGLRLQTGEDTHAWNAGLNLAPSKVFASTFAYNDRLSHKSQLNLVAPGLYDSRATRSQGAQATVKPQLESKLGIDAGYRFERFRQDGTQGVAATLPGYAISPAVQQVQAFTLQNDFSAIHTHEHAVNGGLSYQWASFLTTSAGATYDLKQDRFRRIADTETLAEHAGFVFRVKIVKLETTYRLARSRGGADTQQEAVSAGLDVVPAGPIRWTNRLEYSVSRRPASALTDATSSFEMSF